MCVYVSLHVCVYVCTSKCKGTAQEGRSKAKAGTGGWGGGVGGWGASQGPQDPAVIRIYVSLQLQAPGSRLDTPSGAFKTGPNTYH